MSADYTPNKDYTPTTDEVREGWCAYAKASNDVIPQECAGAEFDRWNAPREEALAATQRVRELANAWVLSDDFLTQTYGEDVLKALEGNHD